MRTGALNKLTARQVKAAGDGMHSDGGGLFLAVGGERRRWVFRFTATVAGGRKKRELGLGSAASVSLAVAREKAAEARALVAGGGDPIAAKAEARNSAAAPRGEQRCGAPTFAEAMRSYITARQPTWSNPKHAAQWASSLERHATSLMVLPVDEIATAEISAVLMPVWLELPETASRVRQRIERILGAQIALGNRPPPNPAALRDNLEHVLPDQRKVREVRHHAAIPVGEAPAAFAATWAKRDAGFGYAGLITVALTALRSGEVRRLEWVDVESLAIVIPKGRMKARRQHRVPVTPLLAQHLGTQPRWADTTLVHPGQQGRPMSDMTLAKALTGSGWREATPHGWRSTFSDWANGEGWPRELIEDQLAHQIGTAVERAYRRGDYLERRREMMEAWETYVAGSLSLAVQEATE